MKKQVTTVTVQAKLRQPQRRVTTVLQGGGQQQRRTRAQRPQQAPQRVLLASPNAQFQPRSTPRQLRSDQKQVGAVVATQLVKIGMSDIRSHRVSWTAGFIFVGNGTNGATNAVLYQTATSTYIAAPNSAANSGFVPILAADSQFGSSYVTDVEKHYARKIIKRMWMHIISLQPSTSNNMMAVVAPLRGGAGLEAARFDPLATANAANTVTNVTSMKGAFSVDSWESKSCEITDFIAGGSGSRQNEFDISSKTQGAVSGSVLAAGAVINLDGDGFCPACFAIAGNNTTTGLQNTQTHQIVIEQEVDLIDYIGGMAIPLPVA
jgi:hypothetical protein